jgi:SnoaL-like domain
MSVTELAAAWNARVPEAVAACYQPDGVRIQIAHPPARIEGRAALVAHVGEIMAAWPDCTLETRSASLGSDGLVTFEWIFRGTQQADYGPLPGRGQPLELAGASVVVMTDGSISEERVYWDTGTLMAAAGVLPSG